MVYPCLTAGIVLATSLAGPSPHMLQIHFYYLTSNIPFSPATFGTEQMFLQSKVDYLPLPAEEKRSQQLQLHIDIEESYLY